MGTETATKAAETFVDQGILGAAVVLLGLAVVYLFVELRRSDKRCADMLERVVEVAMGYKASVTETAEVLRNQQASQAAVVTAVQTLAREAEGEAREARHGIGNVAAVQGALVKLVERLTEGQQATSTALARLTEGQQSMSGLVTQLAESNRSVLAALSKFVDRGRA